MKADIDIPAQVDIETTIVNVTVSMNSKFAHLGTSPGLEAASGSHDFSAYFDALSGPDQLVITEFFLNVIADKLGITTGEVTGTMFVP